MIKYCFSGAALLLLFATLSVAGQQAHLQHLTSEQARSVEGSLDRKLLPEGSAQIRPDSSQIFFLQTSKLPQLTVVPVVFVTRGVQPGQGEYRNCGVYIIAPYQSGNFVVTLGPDVSGETRCDGLEALGAMHDDGSRPRLLLVYSVSSPNVSLRYGVILKWNLRFQSYELDEAATNGLGGATGNTLTIASMRAFLTRNK